MRGGRREGIRAKGLSIKVKCGGGAGFKKEGQ